MVVMDPNMAAFASQVDMEDFRMAIRHEFVTFLLLGKSGSVWWMKSMDAWFLTNESEMA